MAGSTWPMMLDGGTARRRRVAGYAALACLAVLAGSAIFATLRYAADIQTGSAGHEVWRAAWFTIKQAILSTLYSIVAAVPVAIALQSLHAFPGRRLVLALFALPLSLPAIAAVFGILALFGRNGWISHVAAASGFEFRPDVYGLSGILIAHVFFNMPLAVRMLVSAFDQIAPEQFKLAETLRFNAVQRITHVLMPSIRSALPGIAALVFLLCAGSYTIVLTLGGGPQSTTLQVAIQQALSVDFNPKLAALLTLAQLALTVLVLTLLPRSSQSAFANGSHRRQRWHQPGKAETLGAFFCIIAACLITALPLIALGLAGLAADHGRLLTSPLLVEALATSMMIALTSAALSVCAALAIAAAIASMKQENRNIRWVELSANASLGVPPLLLGVGWFLLLAGFGHPFALAPVLIVFANAIMALPFALQLMRPAVERHFAETDRLAAAVRISGWKRLTRIDLPVLAPALLSALFFAGALSFGDLGVITLYGSDHLTTLPALIYRSMGSYRTDDAAGLVFYLVAITGVMAFASLRSARHES